MGQCVDRNGVERDSLRPGAPPEHPRARGAAGKRFFARSVAYARRGRCLDGVPVADLSRIAGIRFEPHGQSPGGVHPPSQSKSRNTGLVNPMARTRAPPTRTDRGARSRPPRADPRRGSSPLPRAPMRPRTCARGSSAPRRARRRRREARPRGRHRTPAGRPRRDAAGPPAPTPRPARARPRPTRRRPPPRARPSLPRPHPRAPRCSRRDQSSRSRERPIAATNPPRSPSAGGSVAMRFEGNPRELHRLPARGCRCSRCR